MPDHGYKEMTKNVKDSRGKIEKFRMAVVDIITTIASGGKTVNTKTFSNNELRDSLIILPYGISSSGTEGLLVQALLCENNRTTMVGVYDKDRPDIRPGEIIIYSKFGQRIKLLENGDISFTTNSHNTTLSSLISRIESLESIT